MAMIRNSVFVETVVTPEGIIATVLAAQRDTAVEVNDGGSSTSVARSFSAEQDDIAYGELDNANCRLKYNDGYCVQNALFVCPMNATHI